MHLTHGPNNLILLVVLKLISVDPVCSVLLLSIQHNPHVMQDQLAVIPLILPGGMNCIDRLRPYRLRIGDVICLPPDVHPKLRRQIRQKPVRSIVRIPQKSNHHHHQQARTHQQPKPQPLYRNVHSSSIFSPIDRIGPTPRSKLSLWPISSNLASGSTTSASTPSPRPSSRSCASSPSSAKTPAS